MKRLASSAKFWAAVAAAVGSVAVALGLPQDRVTAVVTAISSLGAVVVLAIAIEDAASNLKEGKRE